MSSLPSQRQELIMKWLKDKQALTIDELCQEFGVSNMTIHRDLDALVQAGVAEKVHGGVTLAKPKTADPSLCRMCGLPVTIRTGFVIHLQSGEMFQACCPHCGLLSMEGQAIKSALTSDFIYCRMTNVLQATYVIESRVLLCCAPSVLCFSMVEDAVSFQAGFGGQIASYTEAQHWLSAQHYHHGKH